MNVNRRLHSSENVVWRLKQFIYLLCSWIDRFSTECTLRTFGYFSLTRVLYMWVYLLDVMRSFNHWFRFNKRWHNVVTCFRYIENLIVENRSKFFVKSCFRIRMTMCDRSFKQCHHLCVPMTCVLKICKWTGWMTRGYGINREV